jgi:hypothetical protein
MGDNSWFSFGRMLLGTLNIGVDAVSKSRYDDKGLSAIKEKVMADPENPQSSPFRANLTVIVALIAAVMPITTYVNGCGNLAVEREKLADKRGLDYLDRVFDGTKDVGYRSGALDLLVRTTKLEDPMHDWAVEQKKSFEKVQSLKPELEAVTASQQAATSALAKKRELSNPENPKGASASQQKQQEALLQQKISSLNQRRIKILSEVKAAELQTVIKPDTQTEKAIADFRARPGVDEFVTQCVQDGGNINYRVSAGKVQQLDCELVNGSGLLPRIFTEPARSGEARKE